MVNRERVAVLVLSIFLAAATIVIYRLVFQYLHAQDHLQTLVEENQALRRNLTESILDSTCRKKNIETSWELLGGKCYYFSSVPSSWEESRCWCQSRGGDLVKVDSKEEQIFLEKHIRNRLGYYEDKFWIGLTDAVVEGQWVWVDGSPLNQSWSFWNGIEPDDWNQENPEGEDCVRMGLGTGADELKTWFDRSCLALQRFICERRAGGDACP